MQSKAEFRKHYLQKRRALSPAEYERKSLEIKNLFFRHFELDSLNVVHLYYPLLKTKEPNSLLILKALWETLPEIVTACPVLLDEEGQMEQRAIKQNSSLTLGAFQLMEPTDGEVVAAQKTDLALVPLAIADRKGNRLGYGKGFYDRFLAKCRPDCQKVGLLMEEPVEAFPFALGDWDVRLDYLIWPGGVLSVTA